MKLSNFSARFMVAALTLGMGVAVLLFANYGASQPHWMNQFDAACVRAVFTSKTCVTDYDTTTKTLTVHTLDSHPEKSRTFQKITITDDPDHIFEATPPTPLDYAIILQKLHQKGHSNIVITTRMTWDQKTQPAGSLNDEPSQLLNDINLSTSALQLKLAQFDHSVIGLPVTRGAINHAIPAALRRALIPFNQVHGSHNLIPKVNQVSLPSSISGGNNTLAGFHRIENTPENKNAIPLLAHWDGVGIIPSISLLTIMSAHNIAPSQLFIKCGHSIRLGKSGPVIPIDDYGQTPLPDTTNLQHPTKIKPDITAENIIAGTNKTSPSPPTKTLSIIHATGDKTKNNNIIDSDQLFNLLLLCETLPTPGEVVHYHRLPIILEILVLIILALITGRLATLSSYYRNLTFALTGLLLVISLLTLMETNQKWFGLAVPLMALLSVWIISSQITVKTQKPT